MAWNEPGGGNNNPKDPWGSGNQGPPDLDEALKKFQDKIRGLFGGGSSSPASGGSGGSAITAESEPNGGSGTADGPVGSGVAVAGAISSSSDDDWFWFDVASSGNVSIVLDIIGTGDLDWYLYHESDTVNWLTRGYTVNDPETGSYNASPGRYFLRVDGYNGATSSYSLTLTGAGMADGGLQPIVAETGGGGASGPTVDIGED